MIVNRSTAYTLAGAAVLLGLAWLYLRATAEPGQSVAAALGEAAGEAAAGAVGAVAGAAGDAAAGAVVGIGHAVGIPSTNESECERAKRQGRTWDASFACPAGDFITYLFD